jgi:hypothetical protein
MRHSNFGLLQTSNMVEGGRVKERTVGIMPWLAGITIILMILCWGGRQLMMHFHRSVAEYFGAEVVTYYGFSHDVICFTGGSLSSSSFTYCRYDWPYETYLAILTILLIIFLVTWIALKKRWWRNTLPAEMT